MNMRADNISIFKDTERLYTTDADLKEAVAKSIAAQQICTEKEYKPKEYMVLSYIDTQVEVSKRRSLEAASRYAREGRKVCVLNFANAFTPGGGVRHGASAQEEAICRCSTLLPCLEDDKNMMEFYNNHRNNLNEFANDDCIYTPGVVVFKTDDSEPELMDKEDWYSVDIITCAAPDITGYYTHDVDIEEIFAKRIKRIFDIAVDNGAEVLILGAFGCGAFGNNPKLVSKVFYDVQREYLGRLHNIEYAVYCSPRMVPVNYNFFKKTLDENE